MTEAELWGLLLAFTEAGASFGAQLLTIVSAYLAVAYFIGSRLTRAQALVVSAIFAGAAVTTVAGVYVATLRAVEISPLLQQIHPDRLFVLAGSTGRLIPGLAAALELSIIPVSLFFMYQIRKNPKLGASSG
jgi:hypothetical protein